MKKRSWPDLCERLLEKLEAAGVDTSDERGEFATLIAECCTRACGADLRPKGDVNDGDQRLFAGKGRHEKAVHGF